MQQSEFGSVHSEYREVAVKMCFSDLEKWQPIGHPVKIRIHEKIHEEQLQQRLCRFIERFFFQLVVRSQQCPRYLFRISDNDPPRSASDVFSPSETEKCHISMRARHSSVGHPKSLRRILDDEDSFFPGNLPHPSDIGRNAEEMGGDYTECFFVG